MPLTCLSTRMATNYQAKVLSVAPASLLAYWMLAEPSGATAADSSGNARTGTYSNVTLGHTGIGDGRTSAGFNGTTSFCNVYGAGLAGAFNGAEGSLLLAYRTSGAGVWTDGLQRYLAQFRADANNFVNIQKTTANNQLQMTYKAGGTQKIVQPATSSTGVLFLAMTWSKSGDQVKAYVNGAQSGSTTTGLGVWAGSLASTTTLLGSFSTTPSAVASADLAHAALWSTPLTAGQIAYLASAT